MSNLPGAGLAQLLTASTPLPQPGAVQGLVVGQVYPAEVTALLDGKTELLLGNRYLLAASPFSFSEGDKLFLRLTALEPLLTFQLALPGASAPGAAAVEASLASLIRAGGLPDDPPTRATLTFLLNAGLPVTQSSYQDMSMLLNQLPPAVVAAFLPLYRQLLARDIQPGDAVLRQLARLAGGDPAIAGLVHSLAPAARPRSGRGRGEQGMDEPASGLTAAGERLLTKLSGGQGEPSGEELQAMAGLLYSSPEAALRNAESQVELHDLANLGFADTEEAAEVLGLLTALRVQATLPGGEQRMLLPLDVAGEAVLLELEHTPLEQEFYQRSHHLRLRLSTVAQGPVEVHLRTSGTGLSIQLLAQDADTLAAYMADRPQLERELRESELGYQLRGLSISPAALGSPAAHATEHEDRDA